MHGTRNIASALDSQLIYDFTDAGVVVVLDNTRAEAANQLLADTHFLVESGNAKDFDERVNAWVKESRKGASPEERKLIEFFKNLVYKAAKAGRLDRISAFGFQKEDIIDYLDCGSLIPGKTDWENLRERHSHHKGTMWKPWLVEEFGASFSDEDIVTAAEAGTDSMSKEFYDLLGVIASVPRKGQPGF